MPSVRNNHDAKTQERSNAAQTRSNFFSSKAAIAKAKATTEPTYPMYKTGG
jgi:hypothetical protein